MWCEPTTVIRISSYQLWRGLEQEFGGGWVLRPSNRHLDEVAIQKEPYDFVEWYQDY